MTMAVADDLRKLTQLAEIAQAVVDDSPIVLARMWTARAAIIQFCAGEVLNQSNALVAQARELQKSLLNDQEKRSTSIWPWNRATSNEPASFSNFLVSVAAHLSHSGDRGMFSRWIKQFDEWLRDQAYLGTLGQLQIRLQSTGSGAEEFLLESLDIEISAAPIGSLSSTVSDRRNAWSESDRLVEQNWGGTRTVMERAAVLVVMRMAEILVQQSHDDDHWELFRRWCVEWLREFQAHGWIESGVRSDRGAALELYRRTHGERMWLCIEWPATKATNSLQENRRSLRTDPAIRTFLELPPLALDNSSQPSAPFKLAEWHRGLKSIGSDSERAKNARHDLTRWLESDSGEDWLNLAIQRADSRCDAVAQQWIQAIRSSGWVRLYPDIDLAEWTITWDVSIPLPWPGSRSEISDRPQGSVVRVERYATAAERCRFVISDGARDQSPTTVAFGRLVQAVRMSSRDLFDTPLWNLVRGLSLHSSHADRHEIFSAVSSLLDRLSSQLLHQPGSVDHDSVFDAICSWAETQSIEVFPHAVMVDRDGLDVLQQEGNEIVSLYSPVPRGEFVGMLQWGMRTSDEIVRPARIAISAGPCPPELERLEESLLVSPDAAPLVTMVKGLCAAATGGYLQEAAVELYCSYWSDSLLRLREQPAAKEMSSRLIEYLEKCLGLIAFYPRSIFEHPVDWIDIVPGARATSGAVVQIFRPGLQDANNRLICPAVVQAE